MDQALLEKAISFHGHSCPGLALGVRMCEYVQQQLSLRFSEDEQLVCIAETDSCVADAVQALLGCTFGKGNLIYRPAGKTAFSFFRRGTNESIRVVARPLTKEMDRERRKQYIMDAPLEELFRITPVKMELPEPTRLFRTVICEQCGEGTAEHMIRIQNGKCLCIHCFHHYDR